MSLMKKAFLPLMALFIATSCTNDKSNDPTIDNSENIDGVYFSVNITTSDLTRTTTGNEGEEAGQIGENEIYNIQLIFTDKEQNYLTSSELLEISNGQDISSNGASKIFKVTATNAEAFKNKEEIKVYAICNYYSSSHTALNYRTDDKLQKELSLNQYSDIYWNTTKSGTKIYTGLLMSSAEDFRSKEIPSTGFSNDINNPTDLGSIKVQRTMARFDIATALPTEDNKKIGNVVISFDAAALINVSKKFYLFKEVEASENSSPQSFTLLKKEETGLYVNDPKWWQASNNPASDAFIFPLTSSSKATDLSFKEYAALTKNEKSPTGGSMTSEYDSNRTYYIFNYTTPNTIPKADEQKHGVTTGVVFRGEMQTDNNYTIPGMSDGHTLYAYGQVLYGDKENVAIIAANPSSSDVAQQIMADVYNTKVDDAIKTNWVRDNGEKENAFNSAMKNAGFTVYKATSGESNDYHYYCYYYYWNRHNTITSSDNNGEMGIMEYGVVRNNIYKLAITKVSALGHPGDPNDDPDPVKPEDPNSPKPDENAYFSVSVQVVPWSVRVNDIEF